MSKANNPVTASAAVLELVWQLATVQPRTLVGVRILSTGHQGSLSENTPVVRNLCIIDGSCIGPNVSFVVM